MKTSIEIRKGQCRVKRCWLVLSGYSHGGSGGVQTELAAMRKNLISLKKTVAKCNPGVPIEVKTND